MPDHVNRRQTAKGIREQFVSGDRRYVDLYGAVTSIDIGAVRGRAVERF